MDFTTADLYDEFGDSLQVATPMFSDYGGNKSFSGPIATVKVYEDNSLVRAALEERNEGGVLVVDGGESLRCALVGDQLAQLAKDNGWAGMIISGCIRDAAIISTINIGVKALNTNPRKSVKKNAGYRNIAVTFAGVTFKPENHVYADEDGIVISTDRLV